MDGIMGILQYAIDGTSQQQNVIANNLANSETPGYTAQTVDFQSSLQTALSNPQGGTATVAEANSTAPADSDGNNVDTSSQLVSAQQATLQYQTMVDMLNSQFSLVKDAVVAGSGS